MRLASLGADEDPPNSPALANHLLFSVMTSEPDADQSSFLTVVTADMPFFVHSSGPVAGESTQRAFSIFLQSTLDFETAAVYNFDLR